MKLFALQQSIAETLKNDPVLIKHNCEVHAENKGDILNEILSLVAQLGCCALVHTPRLKGNATNSMRPTGMATAVVQVFEEPLFNRGKANRITALDAAERVAVALHRHTLPKIGVLVFDTIWGDAAGDTLSYSVTFNILLDLDGEP